MKKYKIEMIITMLIWGSIGIFVRNINFTSSQIALVRAVLGSLFLISFSFISRETISKEAVKSNIKILIASGICIGFNWIFLFQAYNNTTISVATICYYMSPVIVMFLSSILLKEKLTLIKILCIIGTMSGMFCIVGIDKSALQGNNYIGIIYGLGAACLYACVVILNKYLKNISGRDSSIIQLSIAAVSLIPYVLLTDKISFVGIQFNSIILLILVGIIHTGIAYLIYFTAIQKLPGQTIAIYSYIDPISAIIMSTIILGEKMNSLQIIGGVLILGFTFLSEIYESKLFRNNKYENHMEED